jgi:single-strand DNA-binding protein
MTYQQITIVGNVGRDPELRYTQSGIAVTNFTLAVNRTWQDDDGQTQERVTWWRVTCWRRQAEVVAQYVKKGRQVLVTASQVEADAYAGRDGEPRASLNVTADEVRFLSGGGNANGNPNRQQPAARDGGGDAGWMPPDDANDIPF